MKTELSDWQDVANQLNECHEALELALLWTGFENPSRDGMDYTGPVPTWAMKARNILEKAKP